MPNPSLDLALDLNGRLPELAEALSAGDIDVPRVRVLRNGTCHLPEETARHVIHEALVDASRLTTGQLRTRVSKLCLEADPGEAESRYETAVADRRITVFGDPEGTANIEGRNLPPDRAVAISRKINRIARKLKTAGETRTMDQLRADIFLDLLEGTAPSFQGGASRGAVELQVDLKTLMDLSESGGELAGYGPIIADIARQVAEQQTSSQWTWMVTDSASGMPIHTGPTRRRPTATMRRHIQAKHRTCIFLGCRMPARDCDLDHRIPWAAGGPTRTDYLAPACRHDHIVRHKCGWHYRPLPDGDYLWTSPLGHEYNSSGRSA